MFSKRATFLVGHFGSGKTEIALNAALSLAAAGERACVVDLDVVKPYFRSRSAVDILGEAGVELVAPLGEYFSSDLPIIVPAIRSRLRDGAAKLLLDVGGDDTGVRVVGSLKDSIPADDTDFLLVLNFRRPSTQDVPSAVRMAREIEAAARFSLTGILSNTHLMGETTPALVREGHDLASEAATVLGLPVVGVAAEVSLRGLVEEEIPDCPVFYLNRIVMPPHEKQARMRTTGPLFKVG